MSLQYTPCYYHPDRVATTTCDNCQKPICLEDNRKITNRSVYGPRIYCPTCFATPDPTISGVNVLKVIVPIFIIIGIYMVGLFSIINSPVDNNFLPNLFALIAFFMIALFLYIYYVSRIASKPKRNTKTPDTSTQHDNSDLLLRVKEKEEYRKAKELEKMKFIKTREEMKQKKYQFDLHCNRCGAKTTQEDIFCPDCGGRLTEE